MSMMRRSQDRLRREAPEGHLDLVTAVQPIQRLAAEQGQVKAVRAAGGDTIGAQRLDQMVHAQLLGARERQRGGCRAG